ncbi:MAG: carbohydrate kinase family protein [Methanobacterium sp.]
MKKIDVAGFGALNIDKIYRVNKISCKDDESYIKDFSVSCGGSAANTIIGLSRLGIKTGFIGKISNDDDGKLLLHNLKREGVNTENVVITEGRSGNVLGFVDEDGERALYVDSGVNDRIKFNEINLDYLNNLRVLHLTSFVSNSIEAQKQAMEEISKGITVSFDPGRIYVEKGVNYIRDILDRTNIILINEVELKHLIGNKFPTCKQKAEVLLDYGIEIIVVKRGNKGSYVTDGDKSHNIKPFNVNCIDSTGAGDAFNAGFIYGFIKGKDLKESCIMGNFVAGSCIEMEGAIKGLPELLKLKEMNKNF